MERPRLLANAPASKPPAASIPPDANPPSNAPPKPSIAPAIKPPVYTANATLAIVIIMESGLLPPPPPMGTATKTATSSPVRVMVSQSLRKTGFPWKTATVGAGKFLDSGCWESIKSYRLVPSFTLCRSATTPLVVTIEGIWPPAWACPCAASTANGESPWLVKRRVSPKQPRTPAGSGVSLAHLVCSPPAPHGFATSHE